MNDVVPNMRTQFEERRPHCAMTRMIWSTLAAQVGARLRPAANACLGGRLPPSQAEREVEAAQEWLRGLAEACAQQLFLAGIHLDDIDPEDAFSAPALGGMGDATRVLFCNYVACCHLLTAFGLARSNCAMPEIWPALLIRALSEELPAAAG